MQVADQLRGAIAEILQRELTLPDVGFLTVTDVELSPDLRFARVFVSTLGPKKEADPIVALNKAKGRIRHLIADRSGLRYTPELDFRLDETIAKASALEQTLKSVLPHDSKDDPDTDDNE